MLIITSIFASILAILFLRLSFAVIALRRKNKIALGSGANADLERAIRAQGNFAEYVPINLILMACLEVNLAPWWLFVPLGVLLVIGRVIHAIGINQPPPEFSKRVLGMQCTFFAMIGFIAANLGWAIYVVLALNGLII